MNQNVKEAIEISTRDKRELDLKESITKLKGLPCCIVQKTSKLYI